MIVILNFIIFFMPTFLYCTGDTIITQNDVNGVQTYNLGCSESVNQLTAQFKGAFELAFSHPGKIVDTKNNNFI